LSTVTVDLQEGFERDQVSVAVDGKNVFEKMDVRTRHQIGFAERIELDLEPGPHRFAVSLPGKNASATIDIDTGVTPYLGVSFEPPSIVLNPSSESFGYL